MKNIALYLEDPPTRDGVVSTGLSRVNRHVIAALGERLVLTVLSDLRLRNAVRMVDLDQAVAHKHMWALRLAPVRPWSIDAWRRAAGMYVSLSSTQLKAVANAQKSAEINVLMVPVGTDVGAISRGLQIGDALRVPVMVYMVDDPIADAALRGRLWSKAQVDALSSVLRSCSRVFAITPGLARVLGDRHGVEATCLPLPYVPAATMPSDAHATSDVVFIGNTSHFYRDGLVDCAEAIGRLRHQGLPVRLVCTLGGEFVEGLRKRWGDDTIAVVPCPTDADLARCLSGALAAFAPYSFAEKFGDMVRTSYPSKLTEYLAHSARIIVQAPRDSSAAVLLAAHGLPTLLNCPGPDPLADVIAELFTKRPDCRYQYRHWLCNYHDPNRFVTALIKGARQE